ncbi:MAG: DUF4367 domain-containing protein [Oscillospiraceae bacterium]|nr:DUF4367 domain-containing protein [Oscillospiraceae bacterium]
MKNRITRKTLRRAGFLEREARLSALPEAPAHDFSPAFAQAAAPTLAKGRRSALARDFANRALAAAAALILILTAAVAAIPQARAEFYTWTRQFIGYSVLYQTEGKTYTQDIPVLHFGWIPDGFEPVNPKSEKTNHLSYRNSETGEIFSFHVMLFSENGDFWINGPGNEELGLIEEEITIQNYSARYYHAEGTDDKWLVWVDEDRQILFILDGTIKKEQLYKIAECIEEEN